MISSTDGSFARGPFDNPDVAHANARSGSHPLPQRRRHVSRLEPELLRLVAGLRAKRRNYRAGKFSCRPLARPLRPAPVQLPQRRRRQICPRDINRSRPPASSGPSSSASELKPKGNPRHVSERGHRHAQSSGSSFVQIAPFFSETHLSARLHYPRCARISRSTSRAASGMLVPGPKIARTPTCFR